MLVQGTTKYVVLKGDPDCPHLITTSVYDTKPVHYLSMVCKELKWIVCKNSVYNVDPGTNESLKFLQMSNINNYNHQMGDIDIVDQLRNNYQFNHWLRKRKWWWSIMFWSIGVILVNVYVIYMEVNLEAGKKKIELLSQHDFHMQVAMGWMSPGIYWSAETNRPVRSFGIVVVEC